MLNNSHLALLGSFMLIARICNGFLRAIDKKNLFLLGHNRRISDTPDWLKPRQNMEVHPNHFLILLANEIGICSVRSK
jgi:hypothetical protein